ncbi:MAG: hypothetical protein DRO06_04950, partial [Thermoproteota archaeon]
ALERGYVTPEELAERAGVSVRRASRVLEKLKREGALRVPQ